MSPSLGSVYWGLTIVSGYISQLVHWAPSGSLSVWGRELHWRLLLFFFFFLDETMERAARGWSRRRSGGMTDWLACCQISTGIQRPQSGTLASRYYTTAWLRLQMWQIVSMPKRKEEKKSTERCKYAQKVNVAHCFVFNLFWICAI